jgi:hypothetical protein
MTQQTLSEPRIAWEGFQPIEYELDIRYSELPLKRIEEADGKRTEIATTIGDISRSLADRKILNTFEWISFIHHETVIRTEGSDELALEGPPFAIGILELMLSLHREGKSLRGCQWYWYTSDRRDSEESHSFFLVYGKEIVRESVILYDNLRSGFDPTLLKLHPAYHVWSSGHDWEEAQLRYWYKKFYQETFVGNLMALRSDAPLFHFPEGRPTNISQLATHLRTIRSLLFAILIILLVFLLKSLLR